MIKHYYKVTVYYPSRMKDFNERALNDYDCWKAEITIPANVDSWDNSGIGAIVYSKFIDSMYKEAYKNNRILPTYSKCLVKFERMEKWEELKNDGTVVTHD